MHFPEITGKLCNTDHTHASVNHTIHGFLGKELRHCAAALRSPIRKINILKRKRLGGLERDRAAQKLDRLVRYRARIARCQEA